MTKKSTVSLANTPVQRALRRARRSTLLLLFILGLAAGILYNASSGPEKTGDAPPPAAAGQR